MSDSVEQPTNLSADDQAQRSAAAAGAMLRRARENAGLHVAAMAMSLKVPVKKLEALEAGRIDLLPDPTFARGLAASICRGLKLDPKPVLDLMPHYAGVHRVVEPPAINTRFQPASGDTGARSGAMRPSPVMLAVLLFLLAALAIYFFPATTPDESASGDAPAALLEPLPPPTAPAAEPAAAASVPLALPAPAVADPTPPAPAPLAGASAAANAAQIMVFHARAESWVQVTDATGAVTLRRTMQANETASAAGALPLNVVVGRIDAVQVQLRGQTMDLTSVAKNNVARFEVK